MFILTEIAVMATIALTLLFVVAIWAVTVPDMIPVEARHGNQRRNRRD